jgi:hypothetical protein
MVCVIKRHAIPTVYAELARRATERQVVSSGHPRYALAFAVAAPGAAPGPQAMPGWRK